MKKYFTLVLALAMSITLILCVAGCTKPENSSYPMQSLKYIGDRDLKVKFDSFITLSDILEETSVVDLNMKMGNITGLTKKTENDENNLTSIDYYYRNEDLIYAVYNGYSNNIWEYYTTSKSGSPIAIAFWEEEDGAMVKIRSLDESLSYKYVLLYKNLSSDFGNGAEIVEATVSSEGESYTYQVDGDYYYMSSAIYWKDDNSLHRFSADAEDGKVTYSYDEDLVLSETPEVDASEIDMLKAATTSEGFLSANISLDQCKIYENEGGEIFIEAVTTLVYDSEETANKAIDGIKSTTVNANDFTVSNSYGENVYSIDIGTLVFSVSKSFEDAETVLIDYVTNESARCVLMALSFDENLDIVSLSPNLF